MFSNIRRGIRMNRTHGDIQPYLQRAQDNATAGDSIRIPAGNYMLNGTVTINKFLSLKGHGVNKTLFYRDPSVADSAFQDKQMLYFNIGSTSASNIVLSDIYFKSKKPSMRTTDGGSTTRDIGVEMNGAFGFVVTRCKFEYFGDTGLKIRHDDSIVSGLVYNCDFIHNVKGEDILGLGYAISVYGANISWIADPEFGSSKFIFIENNRFTYHRHSIAGGGCAKYVFRNNYVFNNVADNTSHAIDGHGGNLTPGSENQFATRAFEVYGNNVLNTHFRDATANTPDGTLITPGQSITWLTEACIRPRGGECLAYNNTIKGYRFGTGPVTATTQPYPYPYQTGYLSALAYGASHSGTDAAHADGDLFEWNNTFDIYNTGCTSFHNYTPTYLVDGSEYHLNTAKPSYVAYTDPHPLAI